MASPTLQQRLRENYNRKEWQNILHELFPDGSLYLFGSPQVLRATQDNVKSTRQLGTITLHDGNTIALLEVETSDQVKLARNRVGLRNFVASFIDEAGAAAVLAIFHQESSPDWRLTYAARRTILDEETFAISSVETAPRRFTFVLGENEPCKTAAARLATILEKKADALTLTDVEKAFSVEKLSKEFFEKYQKHYEAFLAELLSPQRAVDIRKRFSIPIEDTVESQSKADKPIRDFTKKLLGRLIFLAFLQRKGWLHAPAKTTDWSAGDKDFLRTYLNLAESVGKTDTFHSAYLAPLFFEALNTERPGHLFPLTGTRIPYLNGGLFEPDPAALQSIDFPPTLFSNLFSFFGEYNFTIDENDPEDHEVGIDPEMLGHIFENLLEDNKDKGAYYTPKVIVSYMCRQSILRYLETHLGKHESLTRLCEIHEPGDLREKGNWCAANAKKIATLLENVKICDPAIGSGAFPIGMLNEIVHLRTLLNSELNDPAARAELKKNIIAHCIHGVDLDSGAVDIARLRFWLALVVDEETPSPLPNLDYKIMQGNSLLESFHGVDLSEIHQEKGKKKRATVPAALGLNQSELDIFTAGQLELRAEEEKKRDEILEAMRAYFAARKLDRKAALRSTIDSKVIAHIRNHLEVELDKCLVLIDQTEKFINRTYPAPPRWTEKKGQKDLAIYQAKQAELQSAIEKLEATARLAERPYFLWHLLFRDVFENEGFDIVIANPPYVRQELIKEQKPLLEKEGYKTFTGTADLLVYFYERATTLLKPSGVLTFITSNKFYRAGYGEKLREYLAKNLTLHTLIDFRDAPVFNGVIAYASILIGQKQTAPADHQTAALCWDLSKPAAALPLEISKAFPVAQSSLTSDGWRLVSPEVQKLLAKLRERGTPLGEYVKGRFYYGIKTGFNEAFVIDGKKRAELIAADPKSEEIIKPFLRGRDVKRWQATPADLWLIKIESSANVDHPWKGADQPWEKFCKTYPAIGNYFESLKTIKDNKGVTFWKRMTDRDDQGTYFWELRSCAYWQEFENPKIIYPDIYEHQSFTIDRTGTYMGNTLYFIPTGEFWMAALLNTDLIEYFYALVSNKARGGYLRAFSDYIQQIPIPPAHPADKARLTELAQACAAATARQDTSTLHTLESEINRIVYRLFDLQPQEIELIESTLENASAIKIPASNQGEVYPPALKSLVLNTLKNLTKKYSYVSLNAVKVELAKTSSKTPEDKTLLNALSEAMAEGIVHDAGRGWYSGIPTPATFDDSHTRELKDLLAKRFPFLPHYLWSTLQLNPWMHHLAGKGIQFLHMDADGEQNAVDFLRAEGWNVLVNPTSKTADRLVPGPKSLVLRTVRREIDANAAPSVDTVLVDALLENGRLNFMDEVERKEMTRRLMQEKRIDFAGLHSRLKNHKKTIGDLIGNEKSGIISEF